MWLGFVLQCGSSPDGIIPKRKRERERERERYLMHSPGAFENLEISLNCLKVKVPQCSIW
jgi:hypothetical protein